VDETPLLTLHEGAMYARMVASLTNDAEDHMGVVFFLVACSDLADDQTAQIYAGEMIARLEIAADGTGELAENAATILANMLGNESPETLALAMEYRRRIIAAKDIQS